MCGDVGCGCGINLLGYVGCGMWDVGCGMWDVGCGMWDVDVGCRDVRCEMWDVVGLFLPLFWLFFLQNYCLSLSFFLAGFWDIPVGLGYV